MKRFVFLAFLGLFLPQSAFAIFYGEDDYVEIAQIPEAKGGVDWQKLARSVGIMIGDPGTKGLDLSKTRAMRDRFQKAPLDPAYKYGQQPRLGKVTVFLIGPDVIMTAGHAGRRQLQRSAFIFDFTWDEKGKGLHKTKYSASEIYRCKKVLLFRHGKEGDYAICRLDRPVLDREALKLEVLPNAAAVDEREAKMISAPDGGPLKLTNAGRLLGKRPSTHAPTLDLKRYFFHDLDNSYGSSGAPIFDAKTGKVIGVQTGGDDNFTMKEGVTFATQGGFKESNLGRALKGEWGCLIPMEAVELFREKSKND